MSQNGGECIKRSSTVVSRSILEYMATSKCLHMGNSLDWARVPPKLSDSVTTPLLSQNLFTVFLAQGGGFFSGSQDPRNIWDTHP